MALNLQDLMKKAALKGITANEKKLTTPVLRPWQQESVLFEKENNLITNREQTDNKPVTIRDQTDNKPVTIRDQTGNKTRTIREQTGNNLENFSEQENKKVLIDNKPVTQLVTQLVTNREQTDNKPVTGSGFSSLVGLQRAILIFIFRACQRARSKVTESLTLEYISKTLNASNASVKTTINRLEAKKMIKRVEYKCGRGGWSRYTIPDELFQELLHNETENKLRTNREQIENKTVTQPITQPITSDYSSSFINKITTTNENTINSEISSDWQKINFEVLDQIRFSTIHLKQLADKNLNPDVIQESILHFGFALKHNEKIKNHPNPLNVLMGVLRKGQTWFENNYRSDNEIALAELLENKQKERERIKKLEEKLFEISFLEWLENLSDEKQKEIIKNSPNPKNMPERFHFSSFYNQNIWPEQKKVLLKIS